MIVSLRETPRDLEMEVSDDGRSRRPEPTAMGSSRDGR